MHVLKALDIRYVERIWRRCNITNMRLEHSAATGKMWISLCRPPEEDQARKYRRTLEKATLVAILN